MDSPHRKKSTKLSVLFKALLAWSASIFMGVMSASASAIPFQIDSHDNGLASRDSEGVDTRENAQQFLNDATPIGSAEEFSTASSFSRAAAGLNVAGGNDIRLFNYQNRTISSASGSTVTLNLQNFTLSGHSTLTLSGDATSTFIVNVTQQFSLAKSARIVLSGGLQWDHVFFNVVRTGPNVSLGRHTVLVGTLTANQRKVRLNGHGTVYGAVFARQVVIRQAAQIIPLPIVSQ
jgi:hypothetical protein